MTPEEKEQFYKQMADGLEKMRKSIEGAQRSYAQVTGGDFSIS